MSVTAVECPHQSEVCCVCRAPFIGAWRREAHRWCGGRVSVVIWPVRKTERSRGSCCCISGHHFVRLSNDRGLPEPRRRSLRARSGTRILCSGPCSHDHRDRGGFGNRPGAVPGAGCVDLGAVQGNGVVSAASHPPSATLCRICTLPECCGEPIGTTCRDSRRPQLGRVAGSSCRAAPWFDV